MSHISELEIEPHTEGRSHILVGAGSRSRLGRLLANEANTPFVHPRFGAFNSLEGYWAYVTAGGAKLSLRADPSCHQVSGISAQRLTIKTLRFFDPDFRKHICEGLDLKIEQTPELRLLLQENDLELVRYERLDAEIVLNSNQKWFMDHLHAIVKRLKCRTRTNKKTLHL